MASGAAARAVLVLLVSCGACNVLGLSCEPTASDHQGPFYLALDEMTTNKVVCEAGASGVSGAKRLRVSGLVQDEECNPVSGAYLNVWQADATGDYDITGPGCRALLQTSDDGTYSFETEYPAEYGSRPRHIHFKVWHSDGGYAGVFTQMYFAGEPNNPSSAGTDRVRTVDKSAEVYTSTMDVTLQKCWDGASSCQAVCSTSGPEACCTTDLAQCPTTPAASESVNQSTANGNGQNESSSGAASSTSATSFIGHCSCANTQSIGPPVIQYLSLSPLQVA